MTDVLAPTTIMQEMIDAGVEISHHESDLYVKVTPESRAIVEDYEFRCNVTAFRSRVDGELWYDVPFAFDPFWIKAQRR